RPAIDGVAEMAVARDRPAPQQHAAQRLASAAPAAGGEGGQHSDLDPLPRQQAAESVGGDLAAATGFGDVGGGAGGQQSMRHRPTIVVYAGGTKPRDGMAQPRCCPPSSAMIWPVIDGAARMNRTATAISSGVVP